MRDQLLIVLQIIEAQRRGESVTNSLWRRAENELLAVIRQFDQKNPITEDEW